MNVFDWFTDVPQLALFEIAEVTFKNGARKGFYRNVNKIELYRGDWILVETKFGGYDIGMINLQGELVKTQMKKKGVKETSDDILKIIRIAKENDLQLMEDARKLEKETMVRARVMARDLKLNMKIGEVEYQADKRKATFYYIADGRVDFRELIKVLAKEFHIKIEMKQIGARQEAGLIGGIGSCGRELCCSTWLTDFKSVSTHAARYQNLAINQAKLSGQCGRLKCCLNYELDTYLDGLKFIPEKADRIETEAGMAFLIKTDIFKAMMWYKLSDSTFPLSAVKVAELLEMNKQGKKPADLTTFTAEREVAEKEIEYADTVGHISLRSLEKNAQRRKKNKNRNNPQKSSPPSSQPQQKLQQPKPNQPRNPNPNQKNKDRRR